MITPTLTETTPYEQALELFRSLSAEERQQFAQQIRHEQSLAQPTGSNGTNPRHRELTVREKIRANPLYTNSDHLLQRLTVAFEQDDKRTFIDLMREIDLSERTPEAFDYLIDLSFALMLWNIGKNLIKKGAEQFPEHAEFQRLKRGFFPENPSRKSQKKIGPIKGLRESYDWLDQHAHKYRGKWIAVNQGMLIGSASTYEEIDEIISKSEDPESTLLQKVL